MEDPEKALPVAVSAAADSPASSNLQPSRKIALPAALERFNAKIESLAGLESRGIARVLPSERHGERYWQMAIMWFSANLTANNLAVGFLGPLVFGLGFVDSALCAVFGVFVGCAGTAYMSIWGAQSGCRTMVVARFFMGYWPAKICCILNIVIMIGYGVIDSIIGGQILSAVSGGSMSIAVGIIIISLITWIVAVLGMAPFHAYERWAGIPQLIVFFILVGSAGPKFNSDLGSLGSSEDIATNRLSFFSLCLSLGVSWASAASDFYVYYPETTSKRKTFLMTLLGLTLAFSMGLLLGVGLASGIASNDNWQEAYNVSSGALVLAGYDGLGGFGKFCGVIVALGMIQNNIPGSYSGGLGFQMLGRYFKVIPRYWWTSITVAISLILALVGRDHLFIVIQNFVALMGYWLTILIVIVVEEHLFRWNTGYDWSAWEDQKRLPLGFAALTAFLIGWAGSVISMYQVWYTGPVAKLVGSDGADLGIWVGCVFAMITYPPLRLLELKFIGR